MRSKVIKAKFPNFPNKSAGKKHKKSRQRLKSNQERFPEILFTKNNKIFYKQNLLKTKNFFRKKKT